MTYTYYVPVYRRVKSAAITLSDMPENVECVCKTQYGLHCVRVRDKTKAMTVYENRFSTCGDASRFEVIQRLDGHPLPTQEMPRTLEEAEEGRLYVTNYGQRARIGKKVIEVSKDDIRAYTMPPASYLVESATNYIIEARTIEL